MFRLFRADISCWKLKPCWPTLFSRGGDGGEGGYVAGFGGSLLSLIMNLERKLLIYWSMLRGVIIGETSLLLAIVFETLIFNLGIFIVPIESKLTIFRLNKHSFEFKLYFFVLFTKFS